MSMQFSRFASALGLLFVVSVTTPAMAAKRFYPVMNTAKAPETLGSSSSFALSFSIDSIIPFSNVYQAKNVGGEVVDMRFQVPTAFGIEFSYNFSPSWELGLRLGYAKYETQVFTGTDLNPRYDTAKIRALPAVELIGRYHWPRKGWAPEVEAGFGTGVGKVSATSSDLSSELIEKSITPWLFHVSGGAGFSWTDELSIHLAGGYGAMIIGAQSYAGTNFTITQASMLSGFFLKSHMKWEF